MIVKLLTEHYLEFLSLKGGCTGWPESTHVKMPHCWKSHALAQIMINSHEHEICHGRNFKMTTLHLFVSTLVFFLQSIKVPT